MSALERNEHVGLLVDQKFRRGINVPFFGKDAGGDIDIRGITELITSIVEGWVRDRDDAPTPLPSCSRWHDGDTQAAYGPETRHQRYQYTSLFQEQDSGQQYNQ